MEMQGNEPRFSVDLLTKPSTSTADATGSLSSMLQSTSSVDNLSSTSLTENVTTVSSLLDKYKKLYYRERAKTKKYKRLLRTMRYNLRNKHSEAPCNESLLYPLFNKDQFIAFRKKQAKKSTKFMKWSNETVVKCLKLKFSCGNNGYNELLRQDYPLPSLRTLQRKLHHIKFDSGILDEVFQFMKIKVQNFESHERDCMLVLDEMAITPGYIFDSSMNKYFGDATLPHHSGTATHVLVFMLGGISTRWKQIVGYYFTGDSVNGAVLKEIIECILQKAEDLKLNILSVTSDMGACNQALWRTWGISASKNSPINCRIPHPLKPDTFLHVFADIPHLFKNIKSMIVQNKVIELPSDIVQKYGLPSKKVLASHISELVAHQETFIFKLAPKLTENDLVPTHFSKMKVSTSTNVISHSVSSALKFLAEVLNKPEYLTTAWFLDQIEKWFYLMTSRHPSCSLSKFNLDVYNESIQFLNDFIYLFSNIKVGYKRSWKPSQSGVRISTQSMLEVHSYLLESKKYQFVLTSRFSQDCLENLFSVLRSKQIVPNAVQVKNNLKLICISQYLKNSSSSSYDQDDREFLPGFLDSTGAEKPSYENVQLPAYIEPPMFNPTHSELNSLYNICGYILQSIIKTSSTCTDCVSAAGSKTPIYNSFAKFTSLKRFREHSLFFCSEVLFYFFLEMETIFRKYISIVCKQNINLKEFFFKKMSSLSVDMPDCHKLRSKIIKRFVMFRLKIYSKKYGNSTKQLASKTIAGHLL